MTAHAAAQDLVGVPFRMGGRDFRPLDGGADCLGVALEFRRRIGKPTPDPWSDTFARIWEAAPDARLFAGNWVEVAGTELELGDVAVLADGTHVGVYAGDGQLLHATSNAGSIISRVSAVTVDAWYRRRSE